jgi:hypothetical protein
VGERLAFNISAPVPSTSSGAAATAQREALEQTVDTFQAVLDRFPPDELAAISAHIQRALSTSDTASPQAALVTALANGRTYGEHERAGLEISALLRYFQRRRQLLEGALTAPQVARLLGISRQTPHDRAKSGSLLAVLDRGVLRFPAWQFDPEGPYGVVPGLPAVLRALRIPPLSKISWLTRPNPYLDGLTPLEALKRGEIERVVDEATAVESGY